jgi:hypothetical protein
MQGGGEDGQEEHGQGARAVGHLLGSMCEYCFCGFW